MALEFDLISPTDKPGLLGISRPETLEACKSVLAHLGYKVHVASNHDDFLSRFSRVQYQVVILDIAFSSSTPAENSSLQALQNMAMNQRRHATVLLLGDSFETLNPMQAFQQSVHGVIHPAELPKLPQILQQVLSDNDLFLNIYREVQLQMAQGKA